MKLSVFIFLMTMAAGAFAESVCDVRVGSAQGIAVVEFATGKVVHSKMALKESSPQAIQEEMINLQDMGVCAEKIISKKCVLRFEKVASQNRLTLFRGTDKWFSWVVGGKKQAEEYVKSLKIVGFCS